MSSFSSDFQTQTELEVCSKDCGLSFSDWFMAHTIHTWPYINRKIKDPFFCCCCAWGRGAIYSNVTHKIWIWKCRFLRRGETRVPSDKPLGVRERTNNKLNPHMASTLGFEPGPHWWGQVLSPLPHPSSLLSVNIYVIE